MAANGISTLATKELRQVAKLELAAAKRAADGNSRPYYDITQLPTQYNDNDIVDNPNTGGLVVGRPWVATAPTPDIVRSDLQLYLDPGEYSGSGTSWTDSSTNAYTVTLNGAPAYNTTYFTFDGTTEYFDTNQSLSSEEFSVGAWFRTSAAGIKMIISKETAAGWPWNYRIWMNGGQIVGDIAQSGASSRSIGSVLTNYNNGSWYYAMYIRDSSTQYLFVNGTQVSTAVGTFASGTISNSQEVWFGKSAFIAGGSNPQGSYQYIGDLGECFVYNRALTSAEILQNYNATKAHYGL